MSDHIPGHDAHHSSGQARTIELLRRALADRADGVEPRPDAYARLATRVTAASSSDRQLSWLPSYRTAAVSVAGLLLLGAGLLVLSRQPQQLVGVADGSSTVSVEPPATGADSVSVPTASSDATVSVDSGASSATSGATAAEQTVEPEVAVAIAEPSPETAPLRASRASAARAFLPLLGVDAADVTIDGDTALIRPPAGVTGDPGPIVATLDLVEVEGGGVTGWVVARAASDQVGIDRLVQADSSDPAAGLTVHGQGSGSESQVVVEIRSAVDGSVLAATTAGAGTAGLPAPFTATLRAAGTERAWVVVRSAGGPAGGAAGGAVGGSSGLAAVAVAIEGYPDMTDYVVVNVRQDDPDGGLNLRAGPGTTSTRIEVMPPGAAVRRTGQPPVALGGEVWWAVETGSGAAGWAAAGFLAAATPLSEAELRSAAETVLAAAADPGTRSEAFPVSPRVGFTLVAGGAVHDLRPGRLNEVSGWQDPLTGDGRSVAEVISAPTAAAGGGGELAFVTNQYRFVDPSVAEIARRDFGSLPHVTVSYQGADGRQHHLHVFVEREPTRVALVGAIAEVGELPPGG